jgi:hypothetical protein
MLAGHRASDSWSGRDTYELTNHASVRRPHDAIPEKDATSRELTTLDQFEIDLARHAVECWNAVSK